MKKFLGEKAWKVNQNDYIFVTLWEAIENGNVNQLQTLIASNNLNINKKKFHDTYLIVKAVRENQPKIVDYLLGIGADPNTKSAIGEPLLHLAIDDEQEAIVISLINAGAKLNEKDYLRQTPLIKAIFKKPSPKIVEALLKAGVDPNQKHSVYGTLLNYVISKDPHAHYLPEKREKIVLLLIEYGAKADVKMKNGWAPLSAAIGKHSPKVVAALLEAGADPDTADSVYGTVLHHVFNNNPDIESPRILLEAGANVHALNEDKQTPLHSACKSKYITEELITLLLSKGADLNALAHSDTPFHCAIKNKQFSDDFLISLLPSIKNKGKDIGTLVCTCLADRHKLLEALITNGANVTPLLKSDFFHKFSKAIQLLLNDPHSKNRPKTLPQADSPPSSGKKQVDGLIFSKEPLLVEPSETLKDKEKNKSLKTGNEYESSEEESESEKVGNTSEEEAKPSSPMKKMTEKSVKKYSPPLVQEEKPKINQQKTKLLAKPHATLQISFAITQNELTLDKELGRGGFGIVFKGRWQHTDVAIKQLQTTQLSEKALEEFQSEMKIMASLNYPNIVRLFGITDSVPYCMVMEYMPKGDLFNLLHSKEQLSAQQIAKIALDIAQGLAYLHQKKILHRDLKSKNILLDEKLRAKVADFGLAKIRTETQTSSTKNIVGTLAWMAPEIIQGETYTLKADIYSFGVILWELTARENPFAKANGNQVLIATWKSIGKKDEIPHGTPEKLGKLIEDSWAQKPEDRPSVEEAVQQLQTENTVTSSAPKSNEYRSNLDSTKSENYRDNFDSDSISFKP